MVDKKEENKDIIAGALSKEGVSDALSELVQKELGDQINVTRVARDEANRASTLDGILSAALLTVGIGLGLAAAMEMLPVVTLTAVGAGIAGTFGVLLGIAAVNNRNEARELDGALSQLEQARGQAKDKTVVMEIAQEKLTEVAPEKAHGKSWGDRMAEQPQAAQGLSI